MNIKRYLALPLITVVLASCGNTSIPTAQVESKQSQLMEATPFVIEGLPTAQGMTELTKDLTKVFKNIPLGSYPTPSKSQNLQPLAAVPSCDFLTVKQNAGYIRTQYAGGSSWYWEIRMNQPYLYYSYDYTIRVNGQIYDQDKNWFNQPEGTMYLATGMLVEITAVGYRAGSTAYGTLLCRT